MNNMNIHEQTTFSSVTLIQCIKMNYIPEIHKMKLIIDTFIDLKL